MAKQASGLQWFSRHGKNCKRELISWQQSQSQIRIEQCFPPACNREGPQKFCRKVGAPEESRLLERAREGHDTGRCLLLGGERAWAPRIGGIRARHKGSILWATSLSHAW